MSSPAIVGHKPPGRGHFGHHSRHDPSAARPLQQNPEIKGRPAVKGEGNPLLDQIMLCGGETGFNGGEEAMRSTSLQRVRKQTRKRPASRISTRRMPTPPPPLSGLTKTAPYLSSISSRFAGYTTGSRGSSPGGKDPAEAPWFSTFCWRSAGNGGSSAWSCFAPLYLRFPQFIPFPSAGNKMLPKKLHFPPSPKGSRCFPHVTLKTEDCFSGRIVRQ